MSRSHPPAAAPASALLALPSQLPAIAYLDVVWTYLTESLCTQLFQAVRTRDGTQERQRVWTLFVMIRFWIALLHDDRDVSQTRAVLECAQDHPLYPVVTATPESFFERAKDFRPAFFQAVLAEVTARMETETWPALAAQGVTFATDLTIPESAFANIYCLDASRADAVAHRLKLLQHTTRAVLPGTLEAAYDVRRGLVHALYFHPDGCHSEHQLLAEVLTQLPPESLCVGDRLHGTPRVMDACTLCGLWLVARQTKVVKPQKVRCLRKVRQPALTLDDWLVAAGGTEAGTVPIPLRYVRIHTIYKGRQQTLTLVTNVLDPRRLSAEQMAALYGYRWTIERMFLTLKTTLRLNRLFNSSPAAVAQQVYATTLLYNALRLAHAQLAAYLARPPEVISPEKLFPLLMDRLERRLWIEVGVWLEHARLDAIQHARDPGTPLPPVDLAALATLLAHHPGLMLPTAAVLREERRGKRKRRRFCAGRTKVTSFAKLPGGKRYLKKLS